MPNTPNQYYIEVAVFAPLRQSFTYLHEKKIPSGARVLIQFGRRQLIGVVLQSHADNHTGLTNNKIKPITQLIDEHPIYTQSVFNLLCWASHYYIHPIGEVFSSAIPVKLRNQNALHTPETLKSINIASEKSALAEKTLARAPKQREIYQHIEQNGSSILFNRLKQEFPNSHSAINALLTKSLLYIDDYQAQTTTIDKPHDFALNAEQQHVLQQISQSTTSFHSFLLQGITGSGKTEVYLALSEEIVRQGRQVLILVPEISLSPQLVRRFTQRFGDTVCVSHSALNDAERYETWWRARQGHSQIILGTRSAVFTPMSQPGMIIIDEEHDASYKQQDGFRYHARDIAVKRASSENIPIILGSATPALESKYNAKQGRYTTLYLSKRIGNAALPEIKLIDTKKFRLFEGISLPLIEALRERMARKEQSILFLNRRGYAQVAQCSACGWQAHCNRCDAFLTYHQTQNALRCHHCNHRQRNPKNCPQCDSELHYIGIGTQRLQASIEQHLPEARLLRLDRDNITTQKKLDHALHDIHMQKVDIIIGTQLIVKGHDFPNVTLVGVINSDQGLYSVDFRATEHLYQQLVQVAGRAGRANLKGEVIIQTAHPQNEDLQFIVKQDYERFAEHCFAQREMMALPPFTHGALFRAEATTSQQALSLLQQVRHYALQLCQHQNIHNISIFDAVDAPAKKRIGHYRAQLFMTAKSRKSLHQVLQQTVAMMTDNTHAKKVRWSVDIDPSDMY